MLDATRIRLRADVPVGAYVSGGLDSAITAALARQLIGGSLHTFSIAFEDPELDESRYQFAVARSLGTQHQVINCSAGDIGTIFPEVVWHMETPVLRTAPAPMYLLSRLVHDRGFKVVLTGEGADEFWGGYDIFKEAKIRAFWARQPESSFRPLLLKRLYPYLASVQRQPAAYLQAFFHTTSEEALDPLFSHMPRWELTHRSQQLFSDAVRGEANNRNYLSPVLGRLPAGFEGWSGFRRAQYLEAAFLLPDYLLSSQGDRVAMAHSVEGRYPFLDYRLVEMSARVPSLLKMKVLIEKYLLKRAFKGQVPREVFERPKQPYRAPQAHSFFVPSTGKPRTDYIAEMLSPRLIEEFGMFQAPLVQKLVERVKAARSVSFLDDSALVGVLSTQILIDQFVHNFNERLSNASNRTRPTTVCN